MNGFATTAFLSPQEVAQLKTQIRWLQQACDEYEAYLGSLAIELKEVGYDTSGMQRVRDHIWEDFVMRAAV